MNDKYYLPILWLFVFFLFSHSSLAQPEVDLSQVSATGLEPNRVNIDKILVNAMIPDPIVLGNLKEVALLYNLDFKVCRFDDGLLRLIPLLEPEEPDCYVEGVDFRESKGFGRGNDRIQLNYLWSQTLISDPIFPHHTEIITKPEHMVFRFEPATLHLVQSFEPIIRPNQIKITLEWEDNSADLDAHLMGPIGPHSPERFHLYFSNEINDVSELKNGEIFEQPKQEIVTIFPPFVDPPQDTLRAGIYTFVVQYFSGFGDFLNSGAKVNLQIGDEPQREFWPPPFPPLLPGEFFRDNLDTWIVFELHLADDGMVSVLPIQNYNEIISPLEVK
jgi:hypothetical protein